MTTAGPSLHGAILAVLVWLASMSWAALAAPLKSPSMPLRSPWDSARVELTGVSYACPAPAHQSPDLTTDGFYSDSKSSVIDPVKWKAYVETSGPIKNLGTQAAAAADAYRTTGSRAAAQCALDLLTSAAADRTLTGKMSSRQAYYVQGWVIGALAISFLKIRDSGLVHPRLDESRRSSNHGLLRRCHG